jgi:WD40 repeat protein
MVWAVVFSPDGKTLATTSIDGTARLWEVASGREVRTLAGRGGYVVAASFSPDGQLLVTACRGRLGAGEDGEVNLWDVRTGQERTSWRGHRGDVHAAAFSPDGLLVASAGAEGTIRIRDMIAGRNIRVHQGHQGDIIALAWGPDGRSLVSGGRDGAVKVWNALAPAEGLVLPRTSLATVSFSRAGELLVGGMGDAELRDPNDGRLLRRLNEPKAQKGKGSPVFAWARAAIMRPDGKQVAYLGHDFHRPGVVVLADPHTGTTQRLIQGHTEPVSALAYTPDGAHLLTGGRDRVVKVWDVAGGEPVVLSGHRLPVVALTTGASRFAVTAGGAAPFIKGDGGELIGWDSRRKPCWEVRDARVGFQSVAMHPSRPIVAAGRGDGTIGLYDADTGRELRRLKGHSGPVGAVAFSPDGNRLASGGSDRLVQVWDWSTAQPALVLEGHGSGVTSVAFHPSGRVLASACGMSFLEVNEVRLWEANVPAAMRSTRYLDPAAVRAWHEETSKKALDSRLSAGAVFHLTRLLQADPESADWRLKRGQALAALRQWEPAEADLRKAAALRTGWAEPLLVLAEMLTAGTQRTAEAARVYASAFAAEPKQADNLKSYHRYNAACAAVRAAAGSGSDAADLADAERVALRKHGLDWLAADLRTRQEGISSTSARARLSKDLSHWLTDTDLASVRDKPALERLSATERQGWEKLWAQVTALRKQLQAGSE